MTQDRQPPLDIESDLRGYFRDLDPGTSPLGLRRRVEDVPASVEREPSFALRRLLTPALGLAAATVILALAVRLLPRTVVESGVGPGATTSPTATFDPTLTGFGLGDASDATGPWALVILAAAILTGLAVRLRGRRAFLPLAGAAAALGYAIAGAFMPIDLHVTGWGPGLNVVGVTLPMGAEGALYYETAEPGEPYSFGLLLIRGDDTPVRIESFIDDDGIWNMTAFWLDGEPNGGMTGPERPFAPFEVPRDAQAVWLVGRASACALGRAPADGESLPATWIETLKVNVTVFGWPRVVELTLPRIVEPWTDPCDPTTDPGATQLPDSSASP